MICFNYRASLKIEQVCVFQLQINKRVHIFLTLFLIKGKLSKYDQFGYGKTIFFKL